MAKHTPEPWLEGDLDRNEQPTTVSRDGALIAVWAHECLRSREPIALANEARARSCVNALAGLDPDDLRALREAWGDGPPVHLGATNPSAHLAWQRRVMRALNAFLG